MMVSTPGRSNKIRIFNVYEVQVYVVKKNIFLVNGNIITASMPRTVI